MTIKDALNEGTRILKSENIEAPALEAGVLLCHVLNREKVYIYAHGEEEMKEADLKRYYGLVSQRAEGTPVQYIIGRQEFMSLPFTVNPHALIPRQDTEVLVETVIEHVKSLKEQDVCILDIGTGSGCIAISLAYYLNKSKVTALDISKNALETAKLNARQLNVADKMEFVQGNLFEGLKNTSTLFDIIVSNPPYIPTQEIETLQVEVREHEPLTALDGGVDGLDFYRAITAGANKFLKPGGLLAFEVGYDQAGDVCRIMEERFCNIRVVKDLAQIERVVVGQLRKT